MANFCVITPLAKTYKADGSVSEETSKLYLDVLDWCGSKAIAKGINALCVDTGSKDSPILAIPKNERNFYTADGQPDVLTLQCFLDHLYCFDSLFGVFIKRVLNRKWDGSRANTEKCVGEFTGETAEMDALAAKRIFEDKEPASQSYMIITERIPYVDKETGERDRTKDTFVNKIVKKSWRNRMKQLRLLSQTAEEERMITWARMRGFNVEYLEKEEASFEGAYSTNPQFTRRYSKHPSDALVTAIYLVKKETEGLTKKQKAELKEKERKVSREEVGHMIVGLMSGTDQLNDLLALLRDNADLRDRVVLSLHNTGERDTKEEDKLSQEEQDKRKKDITNDRELLGDYIGLLLGKAGGIEELGESSGLKIFGRKVKRFFLRFLSMALKVVSPIYNFARSVSGDETFQEKTYETHQYFLYEKFTQDAECLLEDVFTGKKGSWQNALRTTETRYDVREGAKDNDALTRMQESINSILARLFADASAALNKNQVKTIRKLYQSTLFAKGNKDIFGIIPMAEFNANEFDTSTDEGRKKDLDRIDRNKAILNNNMRYINNALSNIASYLGDRDDGVITQLLKMDTKDPMLCAEHMAEWGSFLNSIYQSSTQLQSVLDVIQKGLQNLLDFIGDDDTYKNDIEFAMDRAIDKIDTLNLALYGDTQSNNEDRLRSLLDVVAEKTKDLFIVFLERNNYGASVTLQHKFGAFRVSGEKREHGVAAQRQISVKEVVESAPYDTGLFNSFIHRFGASTDILLQFLNNATERNDMSVQRQVQQDILKFFQHYRNDFLLNGFNDRDMFEFYIDEDGEKVYTGNFWARNVTEYWDINGKNVKNESHRFYWGKWLAEHDEAMRKFEKRLIYYILQKFTGEADEIDGVSLTGLIDELKKEIEDKFNKLGATAPQYVLNESPLSIIDKQLKDGILKDVNNSNALLSTMPLSTMLMLVAETTALYEKAWHLAHSLSLTDPEDFSKAPAYCPDLSYEITDLTGTKLADLKFQDYLETFHRRFNNLKHQCGIRMDANLAPLFTPDLSSEYTLLRQLGYNIASASGLTLWNRIKRNFYANAELSGYQYDELEAEQRLLNAYGKSDLTNLVSSVDRLPLIGTRRLKNINDKDQPFNMDFQYIMLRFIDMARIYSGNSELLNLATLGGYVTAPDKRLMLGYQLFAKERGLVWGPITDSNKSQPATFADSRLRNANYYQLYKAFVHRWIAKSLSARKEGWEKFMLNVNRWGAPAYLAGNVFGAAVNTETGLRAIKTEGLVGEFVTAQDLDWACRQLANPANSLLLSADAFLRTTRQSGRILALIQRLDTSGAFLQNIFLDNSRPFEALSTVVNAPYSMSGSFLEYTGFLAVAHHTHLYDITGKDCGTYWDCFSKSSKKGSRTANWSFESEGRYMYSKVTKEPFAYQLDADGNIKRKNGKPLVNQNPALSDLMSARQAERRYYKNQRNAYIAQILDNAMNEIYSKRRGSDPMSESLDVDSHLKLEWKKDVGKQNSKGQYSRRAELYANIYDDNNNVIYSIKVANAKALGDNPAVGDKDNLYALAYKFDQEMDRLSFQQDGEPLMSYKIRQMNDRLHGVYNQKDKSQFRDSTAGAIAMSMKGYLQGYWERNFSLEHYDATLEKDLAGSYPSMLFFLDSSVRGSSYVFKIEGTDEDGNWITNEDEEKIEKRSKSVIKRVLGSLLGITAIVNPFVAYKEIGHDMVEVVKQGGLSLSNAAFRHSAIASAATLGLACASAVMFNRAARGKQDAVSRFIQESGLSQALLYSISRKQAQSIVFQVYNIVTRLIRFAGTQLALTCDGLVKALTITRYDGDDKEKRRRELLMERLRFAEMLLGCLDYIGTKSLYEDMTENFAAMQNSNFTVYQDLFLFSSPGLSSFVGTVYGLGSWAAQKIYESGWAEEVVDDKLRQALVDDVFKQGGSVFYRKNEKGVYLAGDSKAKISIMTSAPLLPGPFQTMLMPWQYGVRKENLKMQHGGGAALQRITDLMLASSQQLDFKSFESIVNAAFGKGTAITMDDLYMKKRPHWADVLLTTNGTRALADIDASINNESSIPFYEANNGDYINSRTKVISDTDTKGNEFLRSQTLEERAEEIYDKLTRSRSLFYMEDEDTQEPNQSTPDNENQKAKDWFKKRPTL